MPDLERETVAVIRSGLEKVMADLGLYKGYRVSSVNTIWGTREIKIKLPRQAYLADLTTLVHAIQFYLASKSPSLWTLSFETDGIITTGVSL